MNKQQKKKRAGYDIALPLEEQHSSEQHGFYKCDMAGHTSRDKGCGRRMGQHIPEAAALERRQRQEQVIHQA